MGRTNASGLLRSKLSLAMGFTAFHQHLAPLCAQEEGFGVAQTVVAAKKYVFGNQARTNKEKDNF